MVNGNQDGPLAHSTLGFETLQFFGKKSQLVIHQGKVAAL